MTDRERVEKVCRRLGWEQKVPPGLVRLRWCDSSGELGEMVDAFAPDLFLDDCRLLEDELERLGLLREYMSALYDEATVRPEAEEWTLEAWMMSTVAFATAAQRFAAVKKVLEARDER